MPRAPTVKCTFPPWLIPQELLGHHSRVPSKIQEVKGNQIIPTKHCSPHITSVSVSTTILIVTQVRPLGVAFHAFISMFSSSNGPTFLIDYNSQISSPLLRFFPHAPCHLSQLRLSPPLSQTPQRCFYILPYCQLYPWLTVSRQVIIYKLKI